MKRIRIPLFGACILLPLAGIVFADYEEFAEARYQTASLWPETSELCGVANEWEPQIENRVGQEVVIETNKLISAGATVFCFDWTEPDGSAIDLRTYTCPDFSSAKTAMKRELGMMQSTVPMDTGTNGLEHLGEQRVRLVENRRRTDSFNQFAVLLGFTDRPVACGHPGRSASVVSFVFRFRVFPGDAGLLLRLGRNVAFSSHHSGHSRKPIGDSRRPYARTVVRSLIRRRSVPIGNDEFPNGHPEFPNELFCNE